MLASEVDPNFPISHQCDVVKCPLFLHAFLDNFESILQIACGISFIQCECTKKNVFCFTLILIYIACV